MIKCSKIDGAIAVEVSGRATEVAADFCEVIAAVYRTLHPRARDAFKTTIIIAVAHKDSPMWNLEPEGVQVVEAESMLIDLSEAKRQAKEKEDT